MDPLHLRPLTTAALTAAALIAGYLRPLPAQVPVTPTDRVEFGLTVYSGFALIRDTRRPPSGPSRSAGILWTGFSDLIDPGTLVVSADGARISVGQLRVRRAVGGRPGILAGHEGQPVVLVAEDGREIEAVLVSASGPVFRVDERLIFDWRGHVEIPADPLAGTPAIQWRAADLPRGPLTLSYVTDGFSWSADYTAIVQDGGPMAVTGSITIDNRTAFALPEARVQVVAGEVRRGRSGMPPQPRFAMAEARAVELADEAVPEREALGDVHLYTLPGPVTVGALETARAPLFAETRIDVEREYILRGQRFWYQTGHPGIPPRESPEVWLRFENRGLAGDGEPLPAGTLHVYRRASDGTLQFTGDGAIPSTPAGEGVEVAIGRAFDLVAERVQVEFRRLDPNTHESAWRITIRNRSRETRTVHVYEPLAGQATIVEESLPHERVDADTVRWSVPVEAGRETVLTYRVRTTF